MAFILHLFCRALFDLGAGTSIAKNAALFRCRIHRPISHNTYSSLINFVTFSSHVACCNRFVQIEYSVNYLVIQLALNKFLDFYVWVSVHHKLIYIKRTNVMQLGSMFICNCNIALHVSDAFCVHLQEHLESVVAASGEWHETWWGIQQGVQGRWHPH